MVTKRAGLNTVPCNRHGFVHCETCISIIRFPNQVCKEALPATISCTRWEKKMTTSGQSALPLFPSVANEIDVQDGTHDVSC